MKTKTRIASHLAPHQNSKLESEVSIQEKFAEARKALSTALVERDKEIQIALTALIAQEHVLFVGPPGTAKSLIAETIRGWIDGARSCTVHCCKDTSRSMAFGPSKLSALKADRQERILDGGAAAVEILILEEVFKAGPAPLDMFLMLMNERMIREGTFFAKAPLRFMMGVSNEWSPEGCEAALAAFFDRFLFRHEVKPVSNRDGRKALLQRAVANDSCKAVFPHQITLTEIDLAHQEAKSLPLSDACKRALWAILEGLDKEGIRPGDRRTLKAVGAVRAAAYLDGSKEVHPEHLEVLSSVLWVDPQEQPEKCSRIVCKIANPSGMAINDALSQTMDIVDRMPPTEAVPKLQAIQKSLGEIPASPQRDKTIAQIAQLVKDAYNRVIGVQE